jgi:hypothetical protein
MRKSTQCGCVDIQAIVNAICAHVVRAAAEVLGGYLKLIEATPKVPAVR